MAWYTRHTFMETVIVGLGNSGKEYEKTRHNAGRMVVEKFARAHGFPEFTYHKAGDALVSKGQVEGVPVTLVLPETLMNRSGKSVSAFVKSVKAGERLLVVQDELDMPLGTLKMVFERNSGGHKGVESIMRAIKTKKFARLRFGISLPGKKNTARKPHGEEKVVKYVLGKFKPIEEAMLKKMTKRACEAIELFITDGLEKATMSANTK